MLKAGTLAVLAALAAAPSIPPSQSHQQAVRVETDQRSSRAGERAQSAQNGPRQTATSVKPGKSRETSADKCDYECQRRVDERSEYWAILGHRLKITDALLALFTGLLFLVGSVQGGILIWQTILTRREFVVTHRPRLRVRIIETDGLGGMTFITVVNVGETTATIVGIVGVFGLKRGARWLSGRPNLRFERPLPKEDNPVLKCGERRGFGMSMNTPDPAEIIEIENGREVLHAVGVVRYRDDIGTVRATGFCWAYEPSDREFFNPEKTTEYNYED